jgi:peptidyl-prolyl cis-trans isomerase D
MIGTIRKHSKVLWIIIITVVIVSFVVFFSPYTRTSRGGGEGNYGMINGQRVTRDDYAHAQREVYLRYFFSIGQWPQLDNDQAMRETYFRLMLIRKLEDLGIHISSESVAKAAADLLKAFNRGKPLPLDVFEREILAKQNLNADDFARFIQHDLGIQQLSSVLGLGGRLLTPEEIHSIYKRENEQLSAQVVLFSASNHLHDVQVDPTAVAAYYTNHLATYRLPDRVQVVYVAFPASNFMAAAEQEVADTPNLDQQIEMAYERLGGTNYFREAHSVDEAKKIIREQFVKDAALKLARKQSYQFAKDVFAIEPSSTENLGKLAAKREIPVHLSEPFDRQAAPEDLKVGPEFAKRSFALTPEDPFAEPVVGEDAAYFMAFHKKLPSEIPSLEQLRGKVTQDYMLDVAAGLARQAGANFAALLAAGLPNGKAFSAICAEAKVHPITLPPFSLSSRSLPEIEDHVNLMQLKQAAFSVEPGRASELVPSHDGAFLVYVGRKLPIDETRMAAELPQYSAYLRRSRENEAFNEWFRKEAERDLRNTPIARRQPAMGGMPAE